MGDLTRDELIDEIKANLGRINVGTDDILTTRYVSALNLAQTRIARKNNWSELGTSVIYNVTITNIPANDIRFYIRPEPQTTIEAAVSSPEVEHDPIPKDIMQMEFYDDNRVSPLTKLSPRQFRRLYNFYIPNFTSQSVNTGRPCAYTMFKTRLNQLLISEITIIIQFNVAPVNNYTLNTLQSEWPSIFTSGTSVLATGQISMLSRKDDIIISYATSHILGQLGRPTDASRFFAEATDMIKDAIAEDMHDPDLIIRPRGLGDDSSGRRDISNDPFVKSDYGDTW